MSIAPLITFKAGQCELDEETGRVKPLATPGYIYLYIDDDLLHFCWRPRSTPLDSPTIDLLMLPTDGTFTPYQKKSINGRIYALKFSSSPSRHLFWLQSRSQSPTGDPSFFSERDVKLGEIINSLLQGEDVDVPTEIENIRSSRPDDADDDASMEDVEGSRRHGPPRGGPGPGAGATGGDIREEGEDAREGGADGGRAASNSFDAQSIIRNFINSMPSEGSGQHAQQKLFTTLQDLLTPASTVPWIETASEASVDTLLQFLPLEITSLARDDDEQDQPLPLSTKKDILKRVLRSPQFIQSLASLTFALRDGGLPSVSEALDVSVQNGGYMRRGGVPLGGGEAVEAFLTGMKQLVEKEDNEDNEDMQTD